MCRFTFTHEQHPTVVIFAHTASLARRNKIQPQQCILACPFVFGAGGRGGNKGRRIRPEVLGGERVYMHEGSYEERGEGRGEAGARGKTSFGG